SALTLTLDAYRPTIDVAIDRFARIQPDGSVTIRGQYVCSIPEGVGNVGVDVTQATRSGTAFTGGGCSRTSTRWSANVQPDAGSFHAGMARVSVTAYECTIRYCGARHVTKWVIALPSIGRT